MMYAQIVHTLQCKTKQTKKFAAAQEVAECY